MAADVPLKLSSIDLNLLVVLDALLQEPSVTKAGKRVGLSQPATSHALARLRELFGDPCSFAVDGSSPGLHVVAESIQSIGSDSETRPT